MITEDYCSKEVTDLLKEKVFKCGATYSKGFVKDGEVFVGGLIRQEDKITHQMAMKWLRGYPNYIFIGIKNQYIFSYEVYHFHIRCKAPKREIDKVSEVDGKIHNAKFIEKQGDVWQTPPSPKQEMI